MDKNRFKNEVNQIHIPEQELSESISAGIKRANQEKTRRPNRVKRNIFISGAAAVLLLGSGFISPSMQNVLADVPMFGKSYQKFHDFIGQNLVQAQQVTELNQKASCNNIDVTATSVYFDGGIIGMTFKVKSDTRKDLDDERLSLESTVFNGGRKWEIASVSDMKKTDDGYLGYIQIGYPDKEIPDQLTVPVTITSINGIRGKWVFNIPAKKLPYRTVKFKQNNTSDQIKPKKVVIGKESTVIDYEVTASPNEGVGIGKVTDDKGREIDYLMGNQKLADPKRVGNSVQQEMRWILGKVDKDTKYLIIKAGSHKGDSAKTLPLQKTPAVVSADHHDFKIAVDQIKKNGNKLVVNYHLKNINRSMIDIDSMQNFLETMSLIDSAYQTYEEAPNGHSVKGNFTKILDSKKLHFQSVFKIDGEFGAKNFSLDHYSLAVDFAYLSAFYSTPLKPVKVKLTK
ncbi:DUF4179 domain-containing protein [Bacillus sp. CLL-7-23]|uniref:DUF4179 domain-containing protein n=1 Tax=Bacillus changyiensis TaxID=3004103 RepID=A0ABT4WZ56_9BACI|nr:DUF4179 domain-containing protein [Bacillus changyiensis]MDA7025210.1 DUF4179 domain-containing protein [Bacillus changyiensis]